MPNVSERELNRLKNSVSELSALNQIANAINVVVAQRLVRTLCDRCKKPVEDMDPEYPMSLGLTPEEIADATFYEPVGCPECKAGYKGRTGIHEVLYFTRVIKRIIITSGSEVDEDAIREAAIKRGMLTLRRSALLKAAAGITTLEEAVAETMGDEEE